MEELQTALISPTILRKTKEQLAAAMVPRPRAGPARRSKGGGRCTLPRIRTEISVRIEARGFPKRREIIYRLPAKQSLPAGDNHQFPLPLRLQDCGARPDGAAVRLSSGLGSSKPARSRISNRPVGVRTIFLIVLVDIASLARLKCNPASPSV